MNVYIQQHCTAPISDRLSLSSCLFKAPPPEYSLIGYLTQA